MYTGHASYSVHWPGTVTGQVQWLLDASVVICILYREELEVQPDQWAAYKNYLEAVHR